MKDSDSNNNGMSLEIQNEKAQNNSATSDELKIELEKASTELSVCKSTPNTNQWHKDCVFNEWHKVYGYVYDRPEYWWIIHNWLPPRDITLANKTPSHVDIL